MLRSGARADEKTAIMMAAKALYAKWYNAPPSPQGEARSTNPATLDQQKYAHYRAQQMLWDQSPWYNFAENILLPASVNPNLANLDNLAMAAAPFAAASAALNEKAPQAVPQTPGKETLKPSVGGGFEPTGRTSAPRYNAGPLSPIPESYVNRQYNIDMREAPPTSKTNAAGYPRNGPWFWRQMLRQFPELFSEDNVDAINKGRSPVVDDIWIKYHPTHQAFKSDSLVHHHVDQGAEAVGVPEKVHRKWSGHLHPGG